MTAQSCHRACAQPLLLPEQQQAAIAATSRVTGDEVTQDLRLLIGINSLTYSVSLGREVKCFLIDCRVKYRMREKGENRVTDKKPGFLYSNYAVIYATFINL